MLLICNSNMQRWELTQNQFPFIQVLTYHKTRGPYYHSAIYVKYKSPDTLIVTSNTDIKIAIVCIWWNKILKISKAD